MRKILKKFEVTNITGLTNYQINKLEVGDVVAKNTNGQLHHYIVSYKQENVGICLTYTDASVCETVSYDFVEGNWIYNSTDVTELGGSGATYTAGTGIQITNENVINNTQDEVVANPTLAGTEANLTGLQIGNTKFKVPQGGETKYKHNVAIAYADPTLCNPLIVKLNDIINNSNIEFNFNSLLEYIGTEDQIGYPCLWNEGNGFEYEGLYATAVGENPAIAPVLNHSIYITNGQYTQVIDVIKSF